MTHLSGRSPRILTLSHQMISRVTRQCQQALRQRRGSRDLIDQFDLIHMHSQQVECLPRQAPLQTHNQVKVGNQEMWQDETLLAPQETPQKEEPLRVRA